MKRVPEVNEVLYVRMVVTRVLPAFKPGDPPTIVTRPLSDSGTLGQGFAMGLPGHGYELHSIVYPQRRLKFNPPKEA